MSNAVRVQPMINSCWTSNQKVDWIAAPFSLRQARKESQPATIAAVSIGTCDSPMASKTHCQLRKGVSCDRPSATATNTMITSRLQKRTAGPAEDLREKE